MQAKLNTTCLKPTWLNRVIKSWDQDDLRRPRSCSRGMKHKTTRSSLKDVVNLRRYRIGMIAADWQTQGANGSPATIRFRSTKIAMVTTCNRWGVRGKAILTAIDEPVIVLLKSLRSISFPLEADCSNTFWAAICVVMKSDFLEGSNCLVKQFLEIVEIRQQKKKDIWKKKLLTNLDLSFIHVSRKIRDNNFLRPLSDDFGSISGRGGSSSTSTLSGGYRWFSENLNSSWRTTTPCFRVGLGISDDLWGFQWDKGLRVTSWKNVLGQEICPLWVIR